MKTALMHRSLVLAAAAMAIAACGPTTINANLGASPSPSTGATSTSPAPGGSPGTSASSSPTTGSSASPGTGTTGTVTVPQITGNFDFATAQAVKSGDTISGTSDTTNANFFKIALPAGKQDGVLKMTLTEHGETWQPKLTLFGADKNELGGDYADDGTASPFVDQVPVTQGATYYVKLDAASGTNTDFTLAFEFDPVLDVNEPNNSFDTATALTLGKATPFFIYGGWWLADYEAPQGLQFNALFGHSANQEIVTASPGVQLNVDDHVFFRPQISEAVLLQFGDLVVVRGGRIVDRWPVFSG